MLCHSTGLAGDVNIQGEEVKKLDVVANEIFINSLRSSGRVSVMVSEENEKAIFVNDPCLKGGAYCVVFDPLDGSSNIDVGVAVGTIFGIYHVRDGSSGSLEDVLRPGREMIASGYAMYGSFTILVLATAHGVNGFTLDPVRFMLDAILSQAYTSCLSSNTQGPDIYLFAKLAIVLRILASLS